jgi:hypothetical protein
VFYGAVATTAIKDFPIVYTKAAIRFLRLGQKRYPHHVHLTVCDPDGLAWPWLKAIGFQKFAGQDPWMCPNGIRLQYVAAPVPR